MNIDNIDIDKIVLERLKQGYSCTMLAEYAEVSAKTIYNMENRVGSTRLLTVVKVANALGYDFEYFIKGDK